MHFSPYTCSEQREPLSNGKLFQSLQIFSHEISIYHSRQRNSMQQYILQVDNNENKREKC